MEYISFQDIVSAVNGKVVLKGEYDGFNNISTDTRKIEEKDIFFALKGENFNGNEYVRQASKKGASICIVDEIKYVENEIEKKTTVVKVDDAGKAMLNLAEFYRKILDIKVIGVTGSVGKTSTKDLISAALSSKFKVFKTEGNFNNQIGLPKMIFKLDNSYDIAVLEMGMNSLGEIHSMAKAARPDVAVITNIGTAHIGMLKTRENILKAKMEITDFFSKNSILVVNIDNDLLSTVDSSKFLVKSVSIENEADITAFDMDLKEDSVEFSVRELNGETWERISVDVPGKHSVMNALFAIMCCRLFKMSYKCIEEGFKNLQTTKMRLEFSKGSFFNIINDCYNANPDSMMAAMDVLSSSEGKRKIAILGTMGELGDSSEILHKKMGEYAANKELDLLIAVGDYSSCYKEGFKCCKYNKGSVMEIQDYDSIVDFLVKNYIHHGDTVLVKASRTMKFENIVSRLKKYNNC